MEKPGPSRTVLLILIVVILVVAGVGVWAANYVLNPKAISTAPTAQVGDNVTVNYIGQYGNGSQAGKTFDTSLWSVYINNQTYPKSLQFSHGTAQADYTPLPVYVGAANAPYVIDGVNYTPVVTGFWQGMLGLHLNQTRWVTFPDSLGYQQLNPSCTQVVPLSFTVPVLTTVATPQFATYYPGVTPSPGVTFPDPTYKWTDLIFSMNSTDITVEALTSVGFVAAVSGWNATVTAVNATTISLLNDITPQNYGSILGTFSTSRSCDGGNPSPAFTILSVNTGNGTFTENWNSAVAGFTLTFRITLVQIVSS